MASPRVTGYVSYMDFGDEPRQIVQLIEDNHQIGSIWFTDPALFNATIDMLRNEGPNIFWDEGRKRLSIGLEPTGEEES
jgi:hypothetical protein